LDGSPKLGCENKEHVSNWTLTRLKPKNTLEVRQMMYDSNEEFEVGTSGEWFVKYLVPGDNVAIPSDTADPFWHLLVDKGPHFVESDFKDGWGNRWQQGDHVIWGYWYDVLQSGSRTYLLRDDKPLAYVFSHLVLTSKFSLPPTTDTVKKAYATYELSNDAISAIIPIVKDTQ
jgi:hypothetical protein